MLSVVFSKTCSNCLFVFLVKYWFSNGQDFVSLLTKQRTLVALIRVNQILYSNGNILNESLLTLYICRLPWSPGSTPLNLSKNQFFDQWNFP